MSIKKQCLSILFLVISANASAANKIIDIHQWQTKNGAKVLFVPSKDIPMVDIAVAFKAGSSRDGDKEGLAALTSSLLNQGTPHLSADAIAERFGDVGADFSAESARDMAVVSLRTLSDSKYFQPAIATFTEILSQANFPQKSFDREQQAQLSALAELDQNPGQIANRLLYKAVYGNHPYAHIVLGNEVSVKNLKSQDVRQFYKTYYCAQNAVIALVGDLTEDQAKSLANAISAGLNEGQSASPLPDPEPLSQAVNQHQVFPATQTNIRIGQAALKRSSPDFFPLLVGNYSLGGGSLVSRLAEEVREKRGLSYTVYSQFQPMASKGPFIVSLGTKNSQAKDALQITKKVVTEFIKSGPSNEELSAAKKYLTGNFALQLDSNKSIAMNLLVMGFYDLPLDYFDNYRQAILTVKHDDIKAAFQRNVHLDNMAEVSVGGEQAP